MMPTRIISASRYSSGHRSAPRACRSARLSGWSLLPPAEAGGPAGACSRFENAARRSYYCSTMSEPTREQFVDQVITHVRTKFPLVKIARGEQSFSLVINGYPAGLENLYRISLLRPDDATHHVDRWIVELLRAAEGPP